MNFCCFCKNWLHYQNCYFSVKFVELWKKKQVPVTVGKPQDTLSTVLIWKYLRLLMVFSVAQSNSNILFLAGDVSSRHFETIQMSFFHAESTTNHFPFSFIVLVRRWIFQRQISSTPGQIRKLYMLRCHQSRVLVFCNLVELILKVESVVQLKSFLTLRIWKQTQKSI